MGKHHKISSRERDQIAWWAACGVPGREIARRLGRSPSTISDEPRRNRIDGAYGAISAHRAAEARKRNSRKRYLLRSHPGLSAYVLGKPTCGWSPQQIAGRLRKEIRDGLRPETEYINHESIYQFIHDEAQKEEKLWAYLPRGHQKRRRRLGRRSRAVEIPHRVSLRHRPAEIGERAAFGHWEGDTLVGDGHKTALLQRFRQPQGVASLDPPASPTSCGRTNFCNSAFRPIPCAV